MYGLTVKYGKPICVALYSLGCWYAAKGKPIPVLVLLAMHVSEFFLVASKVAKEKGIDMLCAFANCVCFGFTWWLPIKKG